MTQENNTPETENKIDTPEKFKNFVQGGMKVRQDRINRMTTEIKKMKNFQPHRGLISRMAMGRKLTSTQYYKFQAMLPPQVPYAVQDAKGDQA